MKNFAKIFTAIAVAFTAYSCVADATDGFGIQVGNNESQTTITLSFEELAELTRVQLGKKAGDIYPLYWSNGDQIAVNGQVSNVLEGVEANATKANFNFPSTQPPFNIVFPATAGEAVNGCYPISFPAVQQYGAGNVDPKAMALYGYTTGENKSAVQLNHLTSVLQINVKGSATLTSLTVEARGGNIAGTYNINCATGELTEVDTSNTVTMTFDGGLALNSKTATPIYVTLPAGNHDIVWVTLHTETDKMIVNIDSTIQPFNAGCVHEFKQDISYAANAANDVFEISSKSKLIEFANKAADFFPLKKAILTKNINMSGVEWTPIEGFGGFEFDGNGKTITGLSAPLFGLTNAYIHDLTLADVALNTTAAPKSGAFAQSLIDGSLLNCHATGTSTINCSDYYYESYKNGYYSYSHGGLVGFVNNTIISNCTSDVDINILANYDAPTTTSADGEVVKRSYKSAIGGIIGCYGVNVTLKNLINKGNVTYSSTSQTGTLYLSGIAGRDTEHDYEAHLITFSNCTNEGNITTAEGSKSTGAILISGITGFVGQTNNKITATNLVNKGNIAHNGEGAYAHVAGIVANYCRANLTNCSNSGAISIGSNAKTTYTYVGGILAVGVSSETTTLDNCDNHGAITVSPNISIAEAKNICVGGVVANSAGKCIIKNCENTQTVKASGLLAGDDTSGAIIGGICAYANSAVTIEDCTNSGTIQYENATDDENTSYIRVGGIVAQSANGYNCTINNCENTGAISYSASKKKSVEIGVGGIIGYASHITTVQDCTNRGEIGGAGYSGKMMGFGGIAGMTHRGDINIIGCKNYGSIVQSARTLKKPESTSSRISSGYGFGGIVGIFTNASISECENWGEISISNTNGVYVYAGGVIGWAHNRNTSDPSGSSAKTIKNLANYADITFAGIGAIYAAGGVIGCITTFDNEKHYWAEISGLKNVANLTFKVVAKDSYNYYLGGVIGMTEVYKDNVFQNGKTYVALDDCKFYGNITIPESSSYVQKDQLGVLVGSARVATEHIAKNSKVGGKINKLNLHESNNWLTYLYKGGVTASVATADGCSYYKPSDSDIPTKPAN